MNTINNNEEGNFKKLGSKKLDFTESDFKKPDFTETGNKEIGNKILCDQFNRTINYLRISITDRCNLRCLYCIPNQSDLKVSHGKILRYEEILRLVKIGVKLGIKKVRVTGGEPLVRKGVYTFLKALLEIKELDDVSITTNGVLLEQNLEQLQDAGIKRLNLSLDTLDRAKYQKITGYDCLPQVLRGIKKAIKMNFYPIKINTVAMKGINDDEFKALALLTLKYPVHVRFIEYMPIGNNSMDKKYQISTSDIKAQINKIGNIKPVLTDVQTGPAKQFSFDNAPGEIGFISPISQHFCTTCNRLRLTSIGQLRPCLLSDKSFNIGKPLREGVSDKKLEKIFLQSVAHKQKEHKLNCNVSIEIHSEMYSIGG